MSMIQHNPAHRQSPADDGVTLSAADVEFLREHLATADAALAAMRAADGDRVPFLAAERDHLGAVCGIAGYLRVILR